MSNIIDYLPCLLSTFCLFPPGRVNAGPHHPLHLSVLEGFLCIHHPASRWVWSSIEFYWSHTVPILALHHPQRGDELMFHLYLKSFFLNLHMTSLLLLFLLSCNVTSANPPPRSLVSKVALRLNCKVW